MFTINQQCKQTSARACLLNTAHGQIQTPAFMPIGTYAAIKTLSTDEIKQLNYNLVLSNTYHLYLRPGLEILSIELITGLPELYFKDISSFGIFESEITLKSII